MMFNHHIPIPPNFVILSEIALALARDWCSRRTYAFAAGAIGRGAATAAHPL